MKRFTGDTFLGILIAAVCCVMLYVANTTLKAASSAGDPGPKLFPVASCIVVLILAIIVIIESIRKPKHAFTQLAQDPGKRKGLIQMLLVLASLLLFLVMWRFIPFLAAGIIFMLLLCMIFRMKPLFTIIYSLAVPGALYVVFVILLKVRLDI